MNYAEALQECERRGTKNASDPALMAGLCRDTIQLLVGAASPRLVWEGAMKQGMTALELCDLATRDPKAVHDLMWL